MTAIFLGIDPGVGGAIATLSEGGALIDVVDMPVLKDGTKGRPTLPAPLLAEIIFKSHATHAYVERVASRPGQGVASVFSFGRSCGVIEGVLAAASIPVTMLTPATWRAAVGLRSGGDKDLSRSEAIRRWPDRALLFARVKDEGRAEACLIAMAGLLRKAGS